jgi:UDP-galactopyranose mutase
MYDYVIVGVGLTGAVCARELTDRGKRCLVVERRGHIGGNIHTKTVDGIAVHWYGPHVFHTNDAGVWEYVNRFAAFNRFTNEPLANYKGEIYNLPFNMNTFHRMWGVVTPREAAEEIKRQRKAANIGTPRNLEEQAIALVGTEIYEKLIKGYTQKQWGRPCSELPASVIRRLPVRFTYDNNYYDAQFQGVPIDGYTAMADRMLAGIDVELNADYLARRAEFRAQAKTLIFTGCVDEYFGYPFGSLEYRSLRFEHQTLDLPNFQGNAVINYTDRDTPYTRIIEHKHFVFGTQPSTVISREYSAEWGVGDDPFYPVNDGRNQALYERYAALARQEKDTLFAGRLGTYQYLDMDAAVRQALTLCGAETANA